MSRIRRTPPDEARKWVLSAYKQLNGALDDIESGMTDQAAENIELARNSLQRATGVHDPQRVTNRRRKRGRFARKPPHYKGG